MCLCFARSGKHHFRLSVSGQLGLISANTPPLPTAFVKIAWANLFAQAAEQLSLSATPIVAVLMLGAGAGEIGLLASAQTLPFLLLSIPLGLLTDRFSRQRLMVISEWIRTLSLLTLQGQQLRVLFNLRVRRNLA